MAMQDVPWDDETEIMIQSIDAQSGSAVPKLRDLLLNPQKYLLKPGADSTISKARSNVNMYFDALLEDLKDEQAKFTHELEGMSSQYNRISEVVMEKTLSLNVPYITPSYVELNRDESEEITISQYNDSVDQLVGKLTSASKYVADISIKYKEYTLGSWLFSCERPYIITLERPKNQLMYIESSRKAINDLLNDLAEQYGSGAQE
ncbi:MAG: hypothetical protein M1156_01820 [Candidatus Marsarchaeota archaeon]|jgi:hypothetical protein|nr:hypothetical protein [Candidatus Marsarchaeota archaeon]